MDSSTQDLIAESAQVLDALTAPECECDPSVGFKCMICDFASLVTRLRGTVVALEQMNLINRRHLKLAAKVYDDGADSMAARSDTCGETWLRAKSEAYTEILKSLEDPVEPNKVDRIRRDLKHLQWLHDRLLVIHKENANVDYMIRFRDIIKRLGADYGISNDSPEGHQTKRSDSDRTDTPSC